VFEALCVKVGVAAGDGVELKLCEGVEDDERVFEDNTDTEMEPVKEKVGDGEKEADESYDGDLLRLCEIVNVDFREEVAEKETVTELETKYDSDVD
jgi:hypothetical protein